MTKPNALRDQINGLKKKGFKPKRTQGILAKYWKIPEVYNEPHINLSNEGGVSYHPDGKESQALGMSLSPTYLRKFWLINDYPNMDVFMNTINLLNQSELPDIYPTKSGIKPYIQRKRYKKRHLTNYWALVAFAAIQSIKTDKHLMETMTNSTKPFTMYSVKTSNDSHGYSYVSWDGIPKYVGIMEEIRNILKENDGDLPEEIVMKFITDCCDDPSKGPFDGTGYTPIETPKEPPKAETVGELAGGVEEQATEPPAASTNVS